MERVAKFEKVSFEEFKKTVPGVLNQELIFDDSLSDGSISQMYNSISLPKRATKGSAGYDFFAPFSFALKQGQSIKVPTGIRVSMNDDYVLMVFPRSGLGFKYRIQLDNTVGIIDSDYYHSDNEGHIIIKITNDSKEEKMLELENGKAFAQGVFLQYAITVDDNVSEVRNGGFGSTSKL